MDEKHSTHLHICKHLSLTVIPAWAWVVSLLPLKQINYRNFLLYKYDPITDSVYVHTHLSSTSSSSLCRSQAMYSRAMSVIRGHQDKSRLRSLRRFSATSSTPSSVILEQPERLREVRFGRLWTMFTTPWLVISQHEWSRRVWVV